MSNEYAKSKLMARCFNWKAFVVLAPIAVAVFFILPPTQALAIAPFFIFALCFFFTIFAVLGMKQNGYNCSGCVSYKQDRPVE